MATRKPKTGRRPRTPRVFVIAGPNGAGKTTFAREFLPNYAACEHFINADLIACGLSPFAPQTAAVRAGRLMLQEIREMSRAGHDFGFETTLAGRTHLRTLHTLRQQGYRVHLFYLWMPSIRLSLKRVASRVREGGHAVPEAVVRRRFPRSLHNFLTLYRALADEWIMFDNSADAPRVITSFHDGKLKVKDRIAWNAIDKEQP